MNIKKAIEKIKIKNIHQEPNNKNIITFPLSFEHWKNLPLVKNWLNNKIGFTNDQLRKLEYFVRADILKNEFMVYDSSGLTLTITFQEPKFDYIITLLNNQHLDTNGYNNLKHLYQNFIKKDNGSYTGTIPDNPYYSFKQYANLVHEEHDKCFIFSNDIELCIFSFIEGTVYLSEFKDKVTYAAALKKEVNYYNTLEVLFNNKKSYNIDKKEGYEVKKDNILMTQELIEEYRAAADLFSYEKHNKQIVISFVAGNTEIKKVRQYFHANGPREFTVYYETQDCYFNVDTALTEFCKKNNIDFRYNIEALEMLLNGKWQKVETAVFDGMVLIGY